MKKYLKLTALLTCLLFTSCQSSSIIPSKEDIAPTSQTKIIETHIMYTGAIKPESEIQVLPKSAGTVETVKIVLGDKVKKDDILYELDDTDANLKVQQAQNSYDSAKTNYEKTLNGTTVQANQQLTDAVATANTKLISAQQTYDIAQSTYDGHIKVNSAKIALDDATNDYNNAKELYDSNTSIATAQNNYDSAKRNLDNETILFNSGVASKQQLTDMTTAYDNAKSALDTAQISTKQVVDSSQAKMDSANENYENAVISEKSDLNSAEAALSNAKTALKTAQDNLNITQNVLNPKGIDAALEQVNTAKTSLDVANRDLDNTKIKAPIDGIISETTVTKGMQVGLSSALVTIVNLDKVNVEIRVNKDDVEYMKAGKNVSISVEDTNIENLKGTIDAVSSSADLKTGMFLVKISIDNPDHVLKGGMYADVTINKIK